MKFLDDCVHYKGDKPCKHNILCDGCPHYDPSAGSVLIIKTAADGDVLRTTTILPSLAEKYPGRLITWLTSATAAPLLLGNPLIHRVIKFGAETYPSLAPCEFDLLICLDKEPGPAGLATILNAKTKLGVGLGKTGRPVPLNSDARGYFALGLSDELKFKINKKDYHQLIAEALDLPYNGQPPALNITDEEKEYGLQTLKTLGWDGGKKLIGVNTGSGGAFANKMISTVAVLELIDIIKSKLPDSFIVLLGGRREWEKNRSAAQASGGKAVDAGCDHSIRNFAGIVSHCRAVLAGDTLAMHIAIALNRNVVALFGPTCEQEISLFGRGKKIIAPIECAPCYKSTCAKSPNCMDSLNLEEIATEITELLHSN